MMFRSFTIRPTHVIVLWSKPGYGNRIQDREQEVGCQGGWLERVARYRISWFNTGQFEIGVAKYSSTSAASPVDFIRRFTRR